jgi:hypothetical protein
VPEGIATPGCSTPAWPSPCVSIQVFFALQRIDGRSITDYD